MSLMSMTGFGSCEMRVMGIPLRIEIRSVNHRFCDVVVRTPHFMNSLETEISKIVRAMIQRGRIEVFVNHHVGSGQKQISVNLPLAREIYHGLQTLGRDLKLFARQEKPSLELLASFREIFQEPETISNPQTFWKGFQPGLRKALSQLLKMRQREGASLERDLKKRWSELGRLQSEIVRYAKNTQPEIESKLKEKLRDLLQETGAQVNEGRFLQEVLFYSEKSDIQEELTRFEHHLGEFARLLADSGPVGRKLDFLMQELNREANTMGSKTSQVAISKCVVDLKTELERIREQIQNIE